jgi:hypothetical protein
MMAPWSKEREESADGSRPRSRTGISNSEPYYLDDWIALHILFFSSKGRVTFGIVQGSLKIKLVYT